MFSDKCRIGNLFAEEQKQNLACQHRRPTRLSGKPTEVFLEQRLNQCAFIIQQLVYMLRFWGSHWFGGEPQVMCTLSCQIYICHLHVFMLCTCVKKADSIKITGVLWGMSTLNGGCERYNVLIQYLLFNVISETVESQNSTGYPEAYYFTKSL